MLSVKQCYEEITAKVIANENYLASDCRWTDCSTSRTEWCRKVHNYQKYYRFSQISGKCYGRWTSQQVNRGKTYYGLYS